MGSQKIRAVVFDLDDTLFDCTGLLTDPARKRTAESLALKIPRLTEQQLFDRQIELSIEHGSSEALEILGREHGLAEMDIHEAVEIYNRPEVENIHPFPDTLPTLQKLLERNLNMVVVTSGRPERQWQKVQNLGLDSFFNSESGTIYYHDDRLEPRKDLTLRAALSFLQIEPKHVASVGDKLDSEIAASNRLGMFTVRMLHGRQKAFRPAERDQHPDHVIGNLSELLSLIE